MIRAGVGFSSATNPRTAASEATGAALAMAGLSTATGALCFATPAYGAAYPMILRAVATEARTREVVGCSGAGVISGEHEVESGHGLAVLVFGGEEIHATRFFVPTLRGRAAWAHDFNPDRSVAATFQALPGASFVVNGATAAHDAALTTASAEMKWLNGISLAATFEGEFSPLTRSYAGKGVVAYA